MEKLGTLLLLVGTWLDQTAAKCAPCSWVFHAAFGIPAALVFGPWAPGIIFLYREVEQVFFRLRDGRELDWVDHVGDVVIPAAVGLIVG